MSVDTSSDKPTATGDPVIIVGAGLAGAKTAEALRNEGYPGSIVLVGAEDHLPYERPPLSKEFLAGDKSLDEFTVHDRAWYDEHRIEVNLGRTVTTIDTGAYTVTFSTGATATYSALVLATGSRSARPPIPGGDADGVHYLRTIGDAETIKSALSADARLAVVGGGWIGLEVAAGARGRDVQVSVVESASQPLLGALGPELGAVFAKLHREHGVDLRLDSKVDAITTENGRATGLRLSSGDTIAADAVLVAVGARANIELAEKAGIKTADGGILVDAGMRTSAPDVYAVGDIAAAEHPLLHTRIRTEHWANALNQPAVAAANICGRDAAYDNLPYFFTDQYDLGMEYHGHTSGETTVVYRGNPDTREFIAFWLDSDNAVVAGMNVNVWDCGDDIKALITSRRPVDPARLADESVPLTDLVTT